MNLNATLALVSLLQKNTICAALRQQMELVDRDKFLSSILASWVLQDPPELGTFIQPIFPLLTIDLRCIV